MRSTWLAVVLVGVGCSSTPAPGVTVRDGGGSSSTCREPTGTFAITFAERDGTCGALAEQVTVVELAKVPDGCTGTYSTPTATCEVTYDLTCPVEGQPGVTARTRGVDRWQASGARGTGTTQLTIIRADKTQACSSTYDVTYSPR